MAYSQGSVITAADYNTLANNVNLIWSSGSGSQGYGQTGSALGAVSQSATVLASQWQNLIDRLNTARKHQSGAAATSGVYRPNAGDVITWSSVLESQITLISTNRFLTNGSVGGSIGAQSLSLAQPNATTFGGTKTIEVYLAWPSANAMRYFFNAGGLVQFTGVGSTLGGNSKSNSYNTLVSNCGTVNIFASQFYSMAVTPSVSTYVSQNINTVAGGYTNGSCSLIAYLNGSAGGTASVMYCRIVVDDSASADSFDDLIAGTLQLTVRSYLPPTTYLSAPPSIGWAPTSIINSINTAT